MYKHILSVALLVLSFIISPLMSLSAQALSPLANALIKIDGNPTVYWLANDYKRYVFPNSRTFYSWFSEDELNRVVTITPQSMGAIAIGGNVTYRPGVRLVKVTTDPRVYAVSRYGTLRWITSEALAQQLYGQNWAQQVDDVPDEFFINYRIGEPIYTSSQFNAPFEMGQARSPSDNIQTNNNWPSPPTNPSNPLSGQIVLSLNNANPSVGESVAFTARLSDTTNAASDITLSIFSITGETLLVCTNSLSCTHNAYIDTSLAGFGRSYYARVTHRNGQMRDSNVVTLQVRGTSSTSGRPTITVNNANPRIGETVTLTAITNDLNAQQGILSIIGPSGSELHSCSGSYTCTHSFVMTDAIANNIRTTSQGSFAYYARFFYSNRSNIDSTNVVRVYAPSVSTNNTNIPGTSMEVTFNRAEARVGELFTVTATITPQSTGAPYYTIRIYNQWNILQHTCINVRTCVLEQILPYTTDVNRSYYATATADNGQQLTSPTRVIVIQPSSGDQTSASRLGNSQLALTLSNDAPISASPVLTIANGADVRISASIQPALTNSIGMTIKIFDEQGSLLATCSNQAACSLTKTVNNATNQDVRMGFKARVEDAYGAVSEAPMSYVIIRSSQQSTSMISGSIGVGISHASIASGKPFEINARVSNSNVSDQNLKIAWYQVSNDALMSYCDGFNPCMITTSYPVIDGQPQRLQFYAKAWDRSGSYAGELQSIPVEISINP